MEKEYQLVNGSLVPISIVKSAEHLGPKVIAWYKCLGMEETKKLAAQKFGQDNEWVKEMSLMY